MKINIHKNYRIFRLAARKVPSKTKAIAENDKTFVAAAAAAARKSSVNDQNSDAGYCGICIPFGQNSANSAIAKVQSLQIAQFVGSYGMVSL